MMVIGGDKIVPVLKFNAGMVLKDERKRNSSQSATSTRVIHIICIKNCHYVDKKLSR
jgi:hypothetical protein